MRRVAARHAKPGMTLTRSVYDNAGMLLFLPATVLDHDMVNKLMIYGVSEIIISDPRVEDVPVQPLVAPEIEAGVARGVRDMVYKTPPGSKLDPMLVEQLERPVFAMAREFFPDVVGEANVSGGNTDDDYRFMRTAKVASIAMFMGRKLGMKLMEVAQLGIATAFMDVGLTAFECPDLLDNAASNMNPSEAARRQPAVSLVLLQATGRINADALKAVGQHHERWDGSGYPLGLKGQAISLPARILGICDTFFDMVSTLPGRPTYQPHEAAEFLMASSGDLFDRELVELFLRLVPVYPTGITLQLNTGEVGIVSNGNASYIGRPIVRVIMEKAGRVHPYDLNLADPENLGKLVVRVVEF